MARSSLGATKRKARKARPAPIPKLDAALRRHFKRAGAALGLAAPDVAKGKGNSYEAWVIFELAVRLRARVTVKACDHRANTLPPLSRFKARGGPGHIRPAGRAEKDAPCHFALSGSARELEIHLDIEHVGASGETHELDISVVDRADVDAVRAAPKGGPFSGRRHIGLELKAYDEAAMLSPGFARALLGVASDLEVRDPPFTFHCSPRNGGWDIVLDPSHEQYWLITTADLEKKYLYRYGFSGEAYVWPGHNDGVLDDIVKIISAML